MRQELEMTQEQSLTYRFWSYIVKPFQITKVLELLYALNWIWLSVLSFLPRDLVTGVFFQSSMHPIVLSCLLCAFAFISAYSLLQDHIILRKGILLSNIMIIAWLCTTLLQRLPLPGSAGYLIILAALSIFVFWRMDVES